MFRGIYALTWIPVAVTFTQSVGHITWIKGSSMTPTLNPDSSLGSRDLVVLKKYGLRQPGALARGDVVALRSPLDPESIMIKRVLGVGGDVVNPRPSSEYPRKEVKIPRNHLWVEGDNIHSLDSNTFGPISTGLVIGKAVHIIYPFHRWGALAAGGRPAVVPGTREVSEEES